MSQIFKKKNICIDIEQKSPGMQCSGKSHLREYPCRDKSAGKAPAGKTPGGKTPTLEKWNLPDIYLLIFDVDGSSLRSPEIIKAN